MKKIYFFLLFVVLTLNFIAYDIKLQAKEVFINPASLKTRVVIRPLVVKKLLVGTIQIRRIEVIDEEFRFFISPQRDF